MPRKQVPPRAKTGLILGSKQPMCKITVVNQAFTLTTLTATYEIAIASGLCRSAAMPVLPKA